MAKTFIWIGMIVGSTLGGLVPMLWGDDMMSMAGLGLSAIGGLIGIVVGYKTAQAMD